MTPTNTDICLYLLHTIYFVFTNQFYASIISTTDDFTLDTVLFEFNERNPTSVPNRSNEGNNHLLRNVDALYEHKFAGLDFGGMCRENVCEFIKSRIVHIYLENDCL